ncbi:MAG: hypothetical protein AB7O26_05985 [Planctomycetaceae bacterium]
MPAQNPPGRGERPNRGSSQYPDAPRPRSLREREEDERIRRKATQQESKLPGWAIGLGIGLLIAVLVYAFRPASAPLQTVKSSVQAQPIAAAPQQNEVVAAGHNVESAPVRRQAAFIEKEESKPKPPVPVFPVNGSVTLNGENAYGAFIVFHPHGEPLPRNAKPWAQVKHDGSFELTTFSAQDGAPEGEYTVTIQWKKLVEVGSDRSAGDNVMPKRLSKPDTSELKVTVVAGPNNLPTFNLTN